MTVRYISHNPSIGSSFWCAVVLVLPLLTPQFVHAQTLPPAAAEQFQQVIGNRVEAITILGGDYGAAGGIYTVRGGSLKDISFTKLGGSGVVASPRPLDMGDLKWAPVLIGNIGYSTAEDRFASGYLQGNSTSYRIFTLQAGGGARFYFTDCFSIAPAISGIYGHISNTFMPQNTVGEAVKAAASGTYVDWQIDTWSLDPSLELNYEYNWYRVTFAFSSRYNYFHTESFKSSSPVVGVSGDSQTWENKIDVDVPLGWKLLNQELHTGGFFSRTDIFGPAAAGLNTNYIYTLNGRFVLGFTKNMWHLRWIGLGYSQFLGDHSEGWTTGIDVRLEF